LLKAAAPGSRLRLLDVGAGSGDLATYLRRRAARRGVALLPVIIERHPVAARMCRGAGLITAVGDGGQLPLGDGSVDLVLASQLLHHLERRAAVTLLRELRRVCRVGLVVSDLRRHPVAALGIWLASYPLRLHPVTRRDGVTSVRRGFTGDELGRIMREAGLAAEVHRRPGYRLVAVWKSGAGAAEGPPGTRRTDHADG
jgi:ubiquinone/menaquinone biosynthesis C-methylase UbiE